VPCRSPVSHSKVRNVRPAPVTLPPGAPAATPVPSARRGRPTMCHTTPAGPRLPHAGPWADTLGPIQPEAPPSRSGREPGHAACRERSTTVVQSFILIQTGVKQAADVAETIRSIPGVVSAEDVTGPYDVVVRAEANTV